MPLASSWAAPRRSRGACRRTPVADAPSAELWQRPPRRGRTRSPFAIKSRQGGPEDGRIGNNQLAAQPRLAAVRRRVPTERDRCRGIARPHRRGSPGSRRHANRPSAQAAGRDRRASRRAARLEATGERVWEAELHRINGLLLLAKNKPEAAQELLRQAIQVARQQQAKSLELRAAADLARLWGEQGGAARRMSCWRWSMAGSTEGFDTTDLKEAAALLSELTWAGAVLLK